MPGARATHEGSDCGVSPPRETMRRPRMFNGDRMHRPAREHVAKPASACSGGHRGVPPTVEQTSHSTGASGLLRRDDLRRLLVRALQVHIRKA